MKYWKAASSPWRKSRGSRCERRDDECETAGGRRCYSIGDERQRSRWRRAAATRWARGGYGRRLCHSSGPMARIATAPRFAPDTRKTLSRDPRDFHHGLLIVYRPSRAVIVPWAPTVAARNRSQLVPRAPRSREHSTTATLASQPPNRVERGIHVAPEGPLDGSPRLRLMQRRPRGGSGPKTGRETARIGSLERPSGPPACAEATRGSAAIVSSKRATHTPSRQQRRHTVVSRPLTGRARSLGMHSSRKTFH